MAESQGLPVSSMGHRGYQTAHQRVVWSPIVLRFHGTLLVYVLSKRSFRESIILAMPLVECHC